MAGNDSTVDILILGATGFTGRLIVRYLTVHRERPTFTLGIAARSQEKLRKLSNEIGLADDVKQIVFDVAPSNEQAVERVVEQARVVINTIGPYYPTSLPIARACARRGVHYVDLNGETFYVRKLIAEIDLLASKTHAAIIPSCALESLPADVATLLSARAIQQYHTTSGTSAPFPRAGYSHTQYVVEGAGMSRGSAMTAMTILNNASERSADEANPCVLSPLKDPHASEDGCNALTRWLGVRSLPEVRPRSYGVRLPIIAAHNTAIVQRTRGLLTLHARTAALGPGGEGDENIQPLFADAFRYEDSTQVLGTGTFVGACAVGAAIVFGSVSLWFLPPLRWILGKFLSMSGPGPSDEAMEKGHLYVRNITVSEPSPKESRVVAQTIMRGKGDPGYALTAVMASESALCLLTPEKLQPLGREGGVLTPMSALGDALLRRLAASGRFEIESEVLHGA